MTIPDSEAAGSAHTALAVRIGQGLYAIPITAVEEVLPALPIEPLPECPDFILGVVFVRGHLIPVVAAAERFGVTAYQRPLEPHIVCLRLGRRLVGLEVDEALDLVDLGQGVRLTADEIGARRGFFTGVVELEGTVIRLLDPDNLLAEEEQLELDKTPRTGGWGKASVVPGDGG